MLAFLACALAVAAENDCDADYCSRSMGFAAVWTLLMCMVLAVGGTKVMRDHSSEVHVGFFLGVVVVMAFDMFSLCVLFAGNAKAHAEGSDGKSASEATATFAFFLAVAYGVFAVVLAKFRDEVIRVDSAEDTGSDKAAAGDYGGAGGTGAIVESSGDSSTV